MGSTLTGSTTTSSEVPDYLDQAMQDLLAQASQAASIGYMANPNAGVAAFTPMQQSAMQANNAGMQAYGLGGVNDVMAGMPKAQNLGGGVMGYGSHQGFKQAQHEWEQANPGQAAAYNSQFVAPNPPPKPGAAQGGQAPKPQGQAAFINGQWVYV